MSGVQFLGWPRSLHRRARTVTRIEALAPFVDEPANNSMNPTAGVRLGEYFSLTFARRGLC